MDHLSYAYLFFVKFVIFKLWSLNNAVLKRNNRLRLAECMLALSQQNGVVAFSIDPVFHLFYMSCKTGQECARGNIFEWLLRYFCGGISFYQRLAVV